MSFFSLDWLRKRRVAEPIEEAVAHELSDLKTASENLERTVLTVQTHRARHKEAFALMLDETIEAVNRERAR